VIAVKSGYRWVGERGRVLVSEVLLVRRFLFLRVSIFAERFVPIHARHRAVEQEVDRCRYCLDVAVFLGRDVADKVDLSEFEPAEARRKRAGILNLFFQSQI
jgi:hypothetical protein